MVGAGVAELLRPDALDLVGLADHDGLHHAGLIGLALVELRQTIEGHHAKANDGRLKARSTPAGQDGDLGARTHGGGPIDVATRQIARVVERAGIAEIARPPHARFKLHALAIVERGRRLAFARIRGDLHARVRIQFHDEAFAVAGKRGRLDHAAAQDHGLAPFGIQLRAGAGTMRQIDERTRESEPQQAACPSQHASLPPQRDGAQDRECRDDYG